MQRGHQTGITGSDYDHMRYRGRWRKRVHFHGKVSPTGSYSGKEDEMDQPFVTGVPGQIQQRGLARQPAVLTYKSSYHNMCPKLLIARNSSNDYCFLHPELLCLESRAAAC